MHPNKRENLVTYLAAFFKALADPTRLRILNLLLRSRLCVCEMEEVLRLRQPLLSRHIAYLRNSGLVGGHRQGLRVLYQLNERHPLMKQLRPILADALSNESVGRTDLRQLQINAVRQENGTL